MDYNMSLKDQIEKAKIDCAEANKEITRLCKECSDGGHGEIVIGCYGPKCATCHHFYGWPCFESPTKICQYDQRGFREMQNCNYCGKPPFRGVDPANWG